MTGCELRAEEEGVGEQEEEEEEGDQVDPVPPNQHHAHPQQRHSSTLSHHQLNTIMVLILNVNSE